MNNARGLRPAPAKRVTARLQRALKGEGYDVFVAGKWHTWFPSWGAASSHCEKHGWTVEG